MGTLTLKNNLKFIDCHMVCRAGNFTHASWRRRSGHFRSPKWQAVAYMNMWILFTRTSWWKDSTVARPTTKWFSWTVWALPEKCDASLHLSLQCSSSTLRSATLTLVSPPWEDGQVALSMLRVNACPLVILLPINRVSIFPNPLCHEFIANEPY